MTYIEEIEIPYDKIYDINAEAVIITDILIAESMGERERITPIIRKLQEWDFGRTLYRTAFRVIKWLHSDGEEITPANVALLVKLELGHDFSDSLNEMIFQADVTSRIEFDQRVEDVGVHEAVKNPVGFALDYITKIKTTRARRDVISKAMRTITHALEDNMELKGGLDL